MKLNNVQNSRLIHRADLLAFLVAQCLAGADKPTLLQVAVFGQVDKEFIQETRRLDDAKRIYLDASH